MTSDGDKQQEGADSMYAGFPADYQDPPLDGTLDDFRRVIAARVEAIERSLNGQMPEDWKAAGFSWKWTSK